MSEEKISPKVIRAVVGAGMLSFVVWLSKQL